MTDTRAPSALERAARAHWEKWQSLFDPRCPKKPNWDDCDPGRHKLEIAAMRAALEALREDVTEDVMVAGIVAYSNAMKPAVDMLTEAGEHTASQMLRALSGDDFRAVFRAMIDALLAERPEGTGTMTVTVEALERLKDGVAWLFTDDAGAFWWRTTADGPNLSFREAAALAIHGLNCQAAGITAERLGDIQMVPVIDMDEVRA